MSPSSSPPPLPAEDKSTHRRHRDSIDPATDESISPLDPRRFTPTLHASLVSEILSLRRDLEDRSKNIDHLETDLHATREENDTLSEKLSRTTQESRALKRQMQHLEGGTLSAIDELAKERDNAQGDIADLRKRLEQSQKRARSHEENAERTQALWNRDRQAWDADRRTLETKVHVVEGRLKIVLNEVANSHFPDKQSLNGETGYDGRDVMPESPTKRQSFVPGHRRQDTAGSEKSDAHGSRMSNHPLTNGQSTSLADELAFDDDEDLMADVREQDGYSSPDALPEEHERPMSAMSTVSRRSQKAFKVLGLPLDFEDVEPANVRDPTRSSATMPAIREQHSSENIKPIAKYVDSSVQYTPPPSPVLLPDSFVVKQPVPATMVSTSSQTMPDAAVSSEAAPLIHDSPTTVTAPVVAPVHMITSSTQTEPATLETHVRSTWADQLRSLGVPTIAIIPPSSRPVTPTTDVVLPPQTKNASCQAEMPAFAGYVTTEVQTEEIRVDRRPIEIPSHLLPSSNHDQIVPDKRAGAAPSPGALPNSSRRRFRQPPPVPSVRQSSTRSDRDLVSEPQYYPPGNDNGALAEDEEWHANRPIRSSSLFAGFEEESDDESSKKLEELACRDDMFQRPTMKFTLKSGKLVSQDPVVEEDSEAFAVEAGEAAALERLRLSEDSLPHPGHRELPARRSPPKKALPPKPDAILQQLRRVPSVRQTNFRRAALISSGAAAHTSAQSRSLGPSPDGIDPPPFPVPTRFSSRQAQKSASEGTRSITPTSGMSPTKRKKGKTNRYDLRKARSATNIAPASDRGANRSRSPPLNQRISVVPELPSFPHLPNESTYTSRGRQATHGVRPPPVASRSTSHVKTESAVSSNDQTSVVDAIAQTMIGEWMYKYVRRRKSFGITESKPTGWDPTKNADEISASVTSTGIRHKRWVWVAPYERAIMWSSKQPTTESALLGKSGRKLTVQSVLDVRDDNQMPKGAAPASQFNRSILVLTPERALKFTALTRERHYVWLTALSFLSHSPMSFSDLAALPPVPQAEHKPPPAMLAGSLRRRTIRDSILMTKGMGRAGPRSFTADAIMQVPNYEGNDTGDDCESISNAAFPPSVPRFSQHTRKRSNTAPRVPPNSFRSYPQKDSVSLPRQSTTYSHSMATTNGHSSDRGVYSPSLGMQSVQSGSRRGSEASATPPMIPSRRPSGAVQLHGYPDQPVLSSTMKMNAFCDNKINTAKPRGSHRPKDSWKRETGPYWGVEGVEPEYLPAELPVDEIRVRGRHDDPFRGF